MSTPITATLSYDDGCPYWTLAGDDEGAILDFLDGLPMRWFHDGLDVCRVQRGARVGRVKAALSQAAARRGLHIAFVEPRGQSLAKALPIATRRAARVA